MNSHTKKGITLVELIVAMTLTSIFAVLCVMLINPIERTYKSTLKLARAQLLADTLVDSIRKEVDDVRHEEVTDVWITNLSGADDRALLDQNDHAPNLPSGNTLVFRRNNNYTEAIYAAVGITNDNKQDVADNP
ncbi:MAG: prepilin-type N-terminal cleavage/methylation domain-containing protein, partial [Saccharofermentans sp.]|nr:prepilin-type N-terminal cleavage/methylation domain-containing protein [Saccharofermentans sp.]